MWGRSPWYRKETEERTTREDPWWKPLTVRDASGFPKEESEGRGSGRSPSSQGRGSSRHVASHPDPLSGRGRDGTRDSPVTEGGSESTAETRVLYPSGRGEGVGVVWTPRVPSSAPLLRPQAPDGTPEALWGFVSRRGRVQTHHLHTRRPRTVASQVWKVLELGVGEFEDECLVKGPRSASRPRDGRVRWFGHSSLCRTRGETTTPVTHRIDPSLPRSKFGCLRPEGLTRGPDGGWRARWTH